MNAYEIIVTPDAEADLYEIKNYIAETLLAPDVALNYIRVIRKEMEKLSYMADSIRTSTSTIARMKYPEGSMS